MNPIRTTQHDKGGGEGRRSGSAHRDTLMLTSHPHPPAHRYYRRCPRLAEDDRLAERARRCSRCGSEAAT
ncbi:hypothetical protein EVAR_85605_1 [Eumeta japonica]|uniref:Uncharacterized protein n=1 Tax=Eumeta variegata TaxID=151549 RepID=A0A4C1XVQ6_EUMVA|nr:hypothetical protein EVAR_85605_1 [Eumeta japonica]